MTSIQVGIAIGQGTGPELAAVFERVIEAIAKPYGLTITFVRSSRVYNSYSTLLSFNDVDAVTAETLADALHYRQFCEYAALCRGGGGGVCAIFRTSISAQALYMVRDQLQAVKVEHFAVSDTASILLVRDQAQGFYSGTNTVNTDRSKVWRSTYFSKETMASILVFALDRGSRVWGQDRPNSVTMVYKFHLFDGLFHAWAKEWESEYGVSIRMVQGDTMNRDLLAYGVSGRQLIICANEYADIMQTILLDRFGLGPQEHACAENVYLNLGGGNSGGNEQIWLSEYQTAHGSADDLTGQGIVNPVATMRAASAILQNNAGCKNAIEALEAALKATWSQGIATPDHQQGTATTAYFVDQVLQRLGLGNPEAALNIAAIPAAAARSTAATALVVVDFQNDFIEHCSSSGGDDNNNLKIRENIPILVDWARQNGIPVIFVRFLGNDQYKSASWKLRDDIHGRKAWCLLGTKGCDIVDGVTPLPGERVFDKKAVFDPFLVPEFEKYIDQSSFQRLAIVGLYADICVDATTRGAFQRGLTTTIVRDCVASLHIPLEQMLKYMRQVYGSEIVTTADLLLMASSASSSSPAAASPAAEIGLHRHRRRYSSSRL